MIENRRVVIVKIADQTYELTGEPCSPFSARHYAGGDDLVEAELAAGRPLWCVHVRTPRQPTRRRQETWTLTKIHDGRLWSEAAARAAAERHAARCAQPAPAG